MWIVAKHADSSDFVQVGLHPFTSFDIYVFIYVDQCIIFNVFYLEFFAKNKTETWNNNHVYSEVEEKYKTAKFDQCFKFMLFNETLKISRNNQMHICNKKKLFYSYQKISSILKLQEVLLYTSKSFKRVNLYVLCAEI